MNNAAVTSGCVSVYASVFLHRYICMESRRAIIESPGERQLPRGHPAAASLRAIQAVSSFSPQTTTEAACKTSLSLAWLSPDFTVRFTAVTAEVKEERHKNQFLYPLFPVDLAGGVMTEWKLLVYRRSADFVDGSGGNGLITEAESQ